MDFLAACINNKGILLSGNILTGNHKFISRYGQEIFKLSFLKKSLLDNDFFHLFWLNELITPEISKNG